MIYINTRLSTSLRLTPYARDACNLDLTQPTQDIHSHFPKSARCTQHTFKRGSLVDYVRLYVHYVSIKATNDIITILISYALVNSG